MGNRWKTVIRTGRHRMTSGYFAWELGIGWHCPGSRSSVAKIQWSPAGFPRDRGLWHVNPHSSNQWFIHDPRDPECQNLSGYGAPTPLTLLPPRSPAQLRYATGARLH